MERKVIFRDRQEHQAGDQMNVEDFVRESIDNLTYDVVTRVAKFAGFAVTAASQTSINVAPGRYFAPGSGARYINRVASVINIFDKLPLVTKKKLAVVTWGTTVATDVQSRDFLINATTRETEPQSVAMEEQRYANLSTVAGLESPDPQAPSVDANLLVIAYVTLTTTGIESIEMVEANRVPNMVDVEARTRQLENFQDDAEPRISTIASDLSNLAAQQSGLAKQYDLSRIFIDLARVKDRLSLPDDYSDWAADHFLTTAESDTDNVNFLALVEEGIRFSPANENMTELGVFSGLDPNMTLTNGFLLPKFTSGARISSLAYSGELSLAQYGYQTVEVTQKMMSRQRIRYGGDKTVCTNVAWWRDGNYDPNTNIFTRQGETFFVLSGDTSKNHKMIRLQQFWIDTYEEAYWDYVTVDHTIQGAQVAQSFLNAQDGWLTKVGLYFTRKAASGNVYVTVVETVAGSPDVGAAVAHVMLPYSAIKVGTTPGNETIVDLPPTFLEAGKRYAIVITTNADHYVALAGSGTFTQGTLFYSTDGAYFMGDLTKDLMFSLYFAKFENPRVVIQLQPLTLDGGMSSIDILAEAKAPANTNLVYEVQVGGVWKPVSELSLGNFVGLPPLVPLRVVLVGTTDIAPGLRLTGSVCKVSRPRTTFLHLSELRTLAGPRDKIVVRTQMESFNEANHDTACQLLIAGTPTNPTTTEDLYLDPTTLQRTYSFAVTDVEEYVIKITGATSSALSIFHVAERVDYAQ